MAGSSAELHEDEGRLRPETIERHRAIVSIMEELEAVDWYDQRVDGTDDPELAEVLRHNRDEEKEHAVMTLEWLRRHDPVLDKHLRLFLFADGPILEVEEELTGGGGTAETPTMSSGSLGIGSMQGKEEL